MQGQVFTLHDNTAFDAATEALKGRMLTTQAYQIAWCWFTPTAYNGTVNFELSPDGGVTWFPTEAFALSNRGTKITTLPSPTNGVVYGIILPQIATVRLRMSGGSAGTLIAKCRLSDYQAGA